MMVMCRFGKAAVGENTCWGKITLRENSCGWLNYERPGVLLINDTTVWISDPLLPLEKLL